MLSIFVFFCDSITVVSRHSWMHTEAFDGRKYGKHSMFSDFVQLTFSDRTDKMRSPVDHLFR